MRLMGLTADLSETQYQQAGESGTRPDPYLLKGLRVDRPNQVWCSDITYLPIGVAFSTSSPSWTGTTRKASGLARLEYAGWLDFCVEALNGGHPQAFGQPEIMNTD
jgi:putative transposase